MTIRINEEHLGDIATKADAEVMVRALRVNGFDVEYGQPMKRDERADNIPDTAWDKALALTNLIHRSRK